MIDPVIAEDGHTYERRGIEEWFRQGHNTSPATGVKLNALTLIPNVNLRKQIIEWKQLKNAAASASVAEAERNTAANRIQGWWTRKKIAKQKSAKSAASDGSSGGSRRRRCSKRCKRHHRTQTKR
jgi:hypothetical protein